MKYFKHTCFGRPSAIVNINYKFVCEVEYIVTTVSIYGCQPASFFLVSPDSQVDEALADPIIFQINFYKSIWRRKKSIISLYNDGLFGSISSHSKRSLKQKFTIWSIDFTKGQGKEGTLPELSSLTHCAGVSHIFDTVTHSHTETSISHTLVLFWYQGWSQISNCSFTYT